MTKQVLEHALMRDIVAGNRRVVTVKADDTLDHALTVMAELGVTSLPVEKGLSDVGEESCPFLGVIDVADVVMYISFAVFPQNDSPITPDRVSGEKLRQTAVRDAIGLADEIQADQWHNGLYIVKETDSLINVLDELIEGVKRVLVQVGDGYKLLSQTDAIVYLASRANDLKDIVDLTLEQAGLLSSEKFNQLCTVDEHRSALSGLRSMATNKGDAVAVTDGSGSLLSTLSMTDARSSYLRHKNLAKLLEPLTEFLVDLHGTLRPPVKLNAQNTVLEAMEKCMTERIHRVWVVDGAGKPIVCVRVQDILVKFSHIDFKHA